MTTIEATATIRAALKAKGISSRKVSVVADQYSMGEETAEEKAQRLWTVGVR